MAEKPVKNWFLFNNASVIKTLKPPETDFTLAFMNLWGSHQQQTLKLLG